MRSNQNAKEAARHGPGCFPRDPPDTLDPRRSGSRLHNPVGVDVDGEVRQGTLLPATGFVRVYPSGSQGLSSPMRLVADEHFGVDQIADAAGSTSSPVTGLR